MNKYKNLDGIAIVYPLPHHHLDYFVRFLVEKAEQVKQAAIINAEGDSEAALLLAKAFQATGRVSWSSGGSRRQRMLRLPWRLLVT